MSEEKSPTGLIEALPEQRYLTFSLLQEEFAIPLLSVREVIGVPDLTTVPQTPSYFLGLMNLRGQVLSVIDLRLKMGMKVKESPETAVIICDLTTTQIGIVVDSINRVLKIEPSHLSDPSSIRTAQKMNHVSGVYQDGENLVLLLDLQQLLSFSDTQIGKALKSA